MSPNELDHFKEQLAKLYRFSCQKGQIRIRIRYNFSGSGLTKKVRIRRDTFLFSHEYKNIQVPVSTSKIFLKKHFVKFDIDMVRFRNRIKISSEFAMLVLFPFGWPDAGGSTGWRSYHRADASAGPGTRGQVQPAGPVRLAPAARPETPSGSAGCHNHEFK